MTSRISPPPFRKLRGYAIDPSKSTSLSTMSVNELVYKVPWEDLEPREEGSPESYPRGEYLEVIDFDPATGRFYEPVDLDNPHLLAQEGHAPSVGNPQFHQQMVYAVMMTTIKNFEQALGRKLQWAKNIRKPEQETDEEGNRNTVIFEFVPRLRVYPHALRQANAFYDPNKKAILFGYFSAQPVDPGLQLPGATVFTCLSHDIIAHETTHAILDGFHRRYIVATHPDTRAFHEAFADLVALLQHFSFPDVLKHQIAQTRGDLKQQNMLGQLAQEFGKAIGGYGSLRDAIGQRDKDGEWRPRDPDPNEYKTVMSFHQRGGILVAAVFDAFLSIYQHRIQRTLRIATGGTGVLPEGELPPDLVDELADTAARAARDALRICIRASDYCPPMDITFGDYLRAILTADYDMVADDERGYRVAFVEAFQKRGISAEGVKSMAIESLLHEKNPAPEDADWAETNLTEFLREVKEHVGYLTDREKIDERTRALIDGEHGLHQLLGTGKLDAFSELTGLMFPGAEKETEALGLEWGYLAKGKDKEPIASYVVDNLWLANRVTPGGGLVNHVIVTLVQKRGVRCNVDEDGNVTVDKDGFFVPDKTPRDQWGDNHIIFRGGCTLIFDLDTQQLRYAIKKDINDSERMVRQYKHEHGLLNLEDETYFDSGTMNALAGPFAFMHSHTHSSEDD